MVVAGGTWGAGSGASDSLTSVTPTGGGVGVGGATAAMHDWSGPYRRDCPPRREGPTVERRNSGEGAGALHVGLLAPPWLPVPPPAYGGTEAVIDALAVGLRRAGHRVTLVAHPGSRCEVDRVSSGVVADGPIGAHDVEERHAAAGGKLLDDAGVDVLHDHTTAGPAVAATQQGRAAALATVHGPFAEVEQHLSARGAPVVAISHHHASTARRTRPVAVVHHGVDVGRFPAGDGTAGYAVCLARMSPCKGIDLAIETARRAGVPLRIAAKMREPEERSYFDEVIRPLLGGDVDYVGEVAHAEKLELLGGAVALLNPIRWAEPFGMVMLEALACGTPVIAVPNGSVPEIVDHGRTGFVCGDVDALVGALGRVASIDRAACRAHVASCFSVERMVAGYVAVYRRLLEGDEVVDLRGETPGRSAPDDPDPGGEALDPTATPVDLDIHPV
jgi:glycosyltransferase involved in cell wall biosynthesis